MTKPAVRPRRGAFNPCQAIARVFARWQRSRDNSGWLRTPTAAFDRRQWITGMSRLSDLHPKRRWQSIKHALAGWALMLKEEPNSWIHALATLAVVALGWGFSIQRWEWCVLLIAIALVWSAEAFNSSIESLADRVNSEHDPAIKRVKDLAAAAVLSCAIAAAALGLVVFSPYLLALLAS